MHKIKIQTINNSYKSQFDKGEILSLCEEVLKRENVGSYDISIIFVDEDYIIDLNKRFFKKDITTDVISFNLSDKIIEGEVYINFDIIKTQAEYYLVSFDDELKRLIVHGLLHLAGYEDYNKEEKLIMSKKEDCYIKL
ncbi:rRNA maturation RNase YbeY [candidate division KSB1 bacterium]